MIYFIQADGIGHIKIGFTDGENAASRLATLQTGSPVPLRVLHTMPGTLEDEKNLHRRFASAGVGGEWFKAVPDLLALIPAADRKACDGVEIAERTISIRVLTVGRKQFTKSLLSQLPTGSVIDWCGVLDHIGPRETSARAAEAVSGYDLSAEIGADVIWGWVPADSYPPEHDPERWIIYERHGRLFRQRDHMTCRRFVKEHIWDSKQVSVAEALFHARRMVLGLRDEDQLFIGI